MSSIDRGSAPLAGPISLLRRRIATCASVAAGVLALSCGAQPVCADTISIQATGHDAVEISTQWGDYVAYDEGGGNFWVGTQRQFQTARVTGIERSEGDRVSTVNDGADASFVSAKSYRTRVGDVSIDDVVPNIMFSVPAVPHRPLIPKANRYVVATWIQGGTAGASLMLVNPKTGRFIHPYDRGVSGDFQYAEFSVPKASLTDKELLVFMLPNRAPGIVFLKSIAWADYEITGSDLAELRENGIDPSKGDGDQVEQMRKLHLLDPSLK